MPKISVIIPAYNEEEPIKTVIEKVCHAMGGDYEIVVVDDGSTDDGMLAGQ